MLVKHAKDLARQWVIEHAGQAPNFRGAYFAGSVNWFPPDAPLPPTSDVDVTAVLQGPTLPSKVVVPLDTDVTLEVSYAPVDNFRSPDAILADYHMANTFRVPNVILDPSGQLTALQQAVSRDFAKRRWVEKRCKQARNKILRYVDSLSESDPLHDQVTSWLFATGITTHLLLAADLRPTTVRRRYVLTRELLAQYGHLDFYETLLESLGCAHFTPSDVQRHLSSLTEAFDYAKTIIKSPFFFASEISDTARPIAIDGSRELIEQGYHREAIFWITATYCRCQKVLHHDAPPETRDSVTPGFLDLLADLGITSFDDLHRRSEQVKSFLPHVWEVAEAIMAANPDIED